LISFRTMAFSVLCSIESAANLAAMNPSAAKTVLQRPEMIPKLDWDVHGYFDTSPNADSVRNIRFDFYNGELFKIVVTYDTAQTNGLTTDDLVESLSALYGPAGKPETSIIVSDFQAYNDSQQVLA